MLEQQCGDEKVAEIHEINEQTFKRSVENLIKYIFSRPGPLKPLFKILAKIESSMARSGGDEDEGQPFCGHCAMDFPVRE